MDFTMLWEKQILFQFTACFNLKGYPGSPLNCGRTALAIGIIHKEVELEGGIRSKAASHELEGSGENPFSSSVPLGVAGGWLDLKWLQTSVVGEVVPVGELLQDSSPMLYLAAVFWCVGLCWKSAFVDETQPKISFKKKRLAGTCGHVLLPWAKDTSDTNTHFASLEGIRTWGLNGGWLTGIISLCGPPSDEEKMCNYQRP